MSCVFRFVAHILYACHGLVLYDDFHRLFVIATTHVIPALGLIGVGSSKGPCSYELHARHMQCHFRVVGVFTDLCCTI